jgi:hypothetical protein
MARPKSEFLSAMGVAWQIFQAIVNEVLSLGGKDDDLRRILKDGKLRREIASLIVRVEEALPLPPALIPLALGVFIPAVGECKVEDLFRGEYVAFRDRDLDSWLAKTVPATEAGNARSFKLGRAMTFTEVVAERLRMAGASIPELQAEMVRREMYFSPKQAEDIIDAYERGENPLGLLTNNLVNLIPIWDGTSLYFLDVRRSPHGWIVYVYRFDFSGRWYVGNVVFFRN